MDPGCEYALLRCNCTRGAPFRPQSPLWRHPEWSTNWENPFHCSFIRSRSRCPRPRCVVLMKRTVSSLFYLPIRPDWQTTHQPPAEAALLRATIRITLGLFELLLHAFCKHFYWIYYALPIKIPAQILLATCGRTRSEWPDKGAPEDCSNRAI